MKSCWLDSSFYCCCCYCCLRQSSRCSRRTPSFSAACLELVWQAQLQAQKDMFHINLYKSLVSRSFKDKKLSRSSCRILVWVFQRLNLKGNYHKCHWLFQTRYLEALPFFATFGRGRSSGSLWGSNYRFYA